MAIKRNLAMTGAEIRANTALPDHIAWMACHFSPYGTGLCNLPTGLPEGAMLILNDRTPIHGHDPKRIAAQLEEVIAAQKCECLLLDFQRPGVTETARLVKEILTALPCRAAVSEPYAGGLGCPVFLPPVPPDMSVRDHLAPWEGREVWLEAALEGRVITLTENGADAAPLPCWDFPADGHRDDSLHCRYTISLSEDRVQFTLFRTPEDLAALLKEAEALGVSRAVGLYQELGPYALPKERNFASP